VLAQTASMIAKNYNNTNYLLNLIDTPGHVDFSYQVNRSLRACQGAVLLVDATSSIQAQTLSNLQKARDANLKIIPVINKIDLESANVQKVYEDLVLQLDFEESDILKISAKTGEGIHELIQRIIDKIDPPNGDIDKPTKAFLFNADYIGDRGVK
jgi:small GTP-binding protein